MHISQGFYFSYTYDLTRSLQENVMRKTRKNEQRESQLDYSTMMEELGAHIDYADIYAHDFF